MIYRVYIHGYARHGPPASMANDSCGDGKVLHGQTDKLELEIMVSNNIQWANQ